MKNENYFSEQTRMEEIANSISHGIGIQLSVAALVLMVMATRFHESRWLLFSVLVYGITLIILYSTSTLYHSFRSVTMKRFMNYCDHISIYLLIAGTYTPIAIGMGNSRGLTLFGIIWGLAAVGIVIKILFIEKFRIFATLAYVGMGWIFLLAIPQITRIFGFELLVWIIGGGIMYTVGVLFYLNRRIPFNHAFWHVFVLAGSVLHFMGIYSRVVT